MATRREKKRQPTLWGEEAVDWDVLEKSNLCLTKKMIEEASEKLWGTTVHDEFYVVSPGMAEELKKWLDEGDEPIAILKSKSWA